MAIRLALIVLIVGASTGTAQWVREHPPHPPSAPHLLELPREAGEWWSEEIALSETELSVLAADQVVNRLYKAPGGDRVWVFLAYFAAQTVNSQIHSPRNCLPGSGWRVESVDEVEVRGLPASCMRVASDRHQEDVYYWFQTRSGRVSGEYGLKLDLVQNALRRRPTDAVFVRVMAERPQAARELIALLGPTIDVILARSGL